MTLSDLIRARNLVGLESQDIAAALNTVDPALLVPRPQIPKADVLAFLTRENLLARLDRAARNDALNEVIQGVCIQIMTVLKCDSYSVIDTSDLSSSTGIAILVEAGLVAPTQATLFAALAREAVSPAQYHLGGPVTQMDVLQTGLTA